ncbi:hypothetical protein [Mesorhizobium sp. B2-4-12]|uniref:hypothetical protein n=1 Tax=Mesorhizobium sp. B2-4-12 TaxID=2589937 RepID=UPI0015E44636|nr:hypothetical protein [Mesorhizobium sp. B2-4-12]
MRLALEVFLKPVRYRQPTSIGQQAVRYRWREVWHDPVRKGNFVTVRPYGKCPVLIDRHRLALRQAADRHRKFASARKIDGNLRFREKI